MTVSHSQSQSNTSNNGSNDSGVSYEKLLTTLKNKAKEYNKEHAGLPFIEARIAKLQKMVDLDSD